MPVITSPKSRIWNTNSNAVPVVSRGVYELLLGVIKFKELIASNLPNSSKRKAELFKIGAGVPRPVQTSGVTLLDDFYAPALVT